MDPTAYGTRWYLTLFNLSIPFPAQLRVWDVFLLLGDERPARSGGGANAADEKEDKDKNSNGNGKTHGQHHHQHQAAAGMGGLDVLHATSAALTQALRDVLRDADFENAMKVLTSWIPIKDEDLLMKVAKAEWKTHQQGRKKT